MYRVAPLDYVLRFFTLFTGVHHWTMSRGSLLCLQGCTAGPCPEVHYCVHGGASLDHVLRFITGFKGVHLWTMHRERKQSWSTQLYQIS